MGKSLESITAIVESNALPCLIVCPARIRLNWHREIEKWFPDHTEQFSVISYEGLVSGKGDVDAKSIIIDECHALKNRHSKRHKAAIDVCEDKEYAVLLTGTPIVNRPSEGKILLSIIGHDGDTIYGCMIGATISTNEVQEGRPILGRTQSYVRKTWPDVLPFPAIDRKVIELPSKNENNYLAASATSTRHVLSEIHHLRGSAFTQKKDAVVVLARERKEKTILFTWFRAHAMEIAEAMPDSHYIDGDLDFDEREEIIRKFHEDDKPILIATLPSTGEGLNITCATSVIFADLPWTPAAIEQGEARAARIGQLKPTTSFIPIQQNSIDQDIWELLKAKMEYANEFTEGDFIRMLKDKLQAASKPIPPSMGTGLPPEELMGFHGLNKERFETGEYDSYLKWTRPGLVLSGIFMGVAEAEGQYGKYKTGGIQDKDGLLIKFSMPAMLQKTLKKIMPGQEISIKYEGEFESEFTEGRFFKKFTKVDKPFELE